MDCESSSSPLLPAGGASVESDGTATGGWRDAASGAGMAEGGAVGSTERRRSDLGRRRRTSQGGRGGVIGRSQGRWLEPRGRVGDDALDGLVNRRLRSRRHGSRAGRGNAMAVAGGWAISAAFRRSASTNFADAASVRPLASRSLASRSAITLGDSLTAGFGAGTRLRVAVAATAVGGGGLLRLGSGDFDVVEHGLGAVGRQRGDEVQAQGLAGLGRGLVILPVPRPGDGLRSPGGHRFPRWAGSSARRNRARSRLRRARAAAATLEGLSSQMLYDRPHELTSIASASACSNWLFASSSRASLSLARACFLSWAP